MERGLLLGSLFLFFKGNLPAAGGFPNSTVALEVAAGLETQNGWTTEEALGLMDMAVVSRGI